MVIILTERAGRRTGHHCISSLLPSALMLFALGQACIPCPSSHPRLDSHTDLLLTGLFTPALPLQILQTKELGPRVISDHVSSFHDFQCLEENIQIPCKTIINHFYLSNVVIFSQGQFVSFASQRTFDNACGHF